MKKYLLSILCFSLGIITLNSCSNEDENITNPVEVTVSDGVFILNEGSFYNNISGSLDYLDYSKGAVTRSVFSSVNGRSLGGTPNDALIANGKMYIVTSDENRVEVVDTATMKALTPIVITTPRCLAADGNNVYVTSYTGKVSKINATTDKIEVTSESIGEHLEGIAVRGRYLYVCNSTNADYTYNKNVVKLNATDMSKISDINVEENPNEILCQNNNIYVISWGNYGSVKSCLQKIDNNDTVTKLFEGATYMACNNKTMYIVDDPYSNPICKIYNIDSNQVSSTTFGTEAACPHAIGVDPVSGNVFVSSYSKDSGTGYTSFTSDGTLTEYTANGVFVKQYVIGVGPGTLVFTSHKEKK